MLGQIRTSKSEPKEFSLPDEFSFCVGRPWPAEGTHRLSPDNISVYAHGSQVHCGTMQDAEAFRDYVNQMTGEKNFIYRLIQVGK